MSDLSGSRCLLIAPLTFYSFHRTLASALEKRGYFVDILNEEYPDSAFGKILGKLALPLLRITTLTELKRRLSQAHHYDLVVIIKGRGLGPDAIEFLRMRGNRIIGYNFDSFEYNPSARDWHHLVDRYATFDIDDASKESIPLVHLFSAAQNLNFPNKRRYDLSIVQRLHSDRLEYTAKMLDALPEGTRSFVFLYQSSRLLFLLGFLRQPFLYLRLWRYIFFRPLPYDEAMRVLADSRVTFDYAHPRQSGITVRCFEAQSLGTAILTNNRAAVDSGMFPAGSIAYISPEATPEVVREAFVELAGQSPALISRSLDNFLDDLLGEDN